jgi:hypothetical protein
MPRARTTRAARAARAAATLVPDRREVVQTTAWAVPALLTTNTYASCGQFVRQVLLSLQHEAPGVWGYLGKTAVEQQAIFPPGVTRHVGTHTLTGVSHDVIVHLPTGTQIDILANAAARSDPRPEIWSDARPAWEPIPPEHYRAHNPPLPLLPDPWGPPPDPDLDPDPDVPPPPPEPSYTVLADTEVSLGASGDNLPFAVGTVPETAPWMLFTSEAWLTPGQAFRRGSGEQRVHVVPNHSTTPRSGEVAVYGTIRGEDVRLHRCVVHQAGLPTPQPPPRRTWAQILNDLLTRWLRGGGW